VGHQLLNALTAGHDAVVQMIDTSIVRMHQHGACTASNSEQLMGRSRGGLTTKIHAFVDASGLPVRLALTTGEAHDNRHVLALLSGLRSGAMLLADRRFDADWMRALVSQYGAWANIPPRRNRTEPALVPTYLAPGIWSSGSSTRSSNVAGSRPVMTSLRQLPSLHPACLNQTRAAVNKSVRHSPFWSIRSDAAMELTVWVGLVLWCGITPRVEDKPKGRRPAKRH
jgi:transposase